MSVGTFAAAQLLRLVPRVGVSHAVGRLCEMSLSPQVSKWVSGMYSRAYGVNLEEAEAVDGGYPSFDAFFTRKLRQGVRSIDDSVLVSPADGKLASKGPIDAEASIVAKGQAYKVAELTGEPEDAQRYQGGQFGVVYLSPRDYHRVHSPVDGELHYARSIAGDLYPVNAIGEQHVPGLFVKNQRVSLPIQTENHGRVTVILVGATIVGRITVTGLEQESTPPGLHPFSPPRQIKRGDEIGVFHLGSTAVLLVEPGLGIERELGPILYGHALVKN
ncbi:MAG TPA: archaetidylserine decarboxylase [Polyangiaceae bacterium]|nr:archaetidylserine decarboxylase [Polyangiaceae bacterium]